jgi:UDP-N-acetylglucosamine--N-acetylmuramyl-(pentapeptide) pyrophosphoryl-undecaprenol N-acetylglucosamine transferase
MAKRIALAGGGTGGHIYPLVTVAEYIRDNYGVNEEVEFRFFGPSNSLEKQIMESHSISQRGVISGKLRRYFSIKNFIDIFKFPIGLLQSLIHLLFFMPDVVFAKGGYASVPVVIAARIYRIPVIIHESDSFPGMANKFLGSIASKVAVCFEKARMHFPPSRTIMTGIPVKKEAKDGNPEIARNLLGIIQNKPVILVLGGSQGARSINDEILLILDDLLKKYTVIHQTGEKNLADVLSAVKLHYKTDKVEGYFPLDFIGDELRDFYSLADVVISRSGSTSIAEIAANKKPAILVPLLSSANDHQKINAFEVADAGGAIVLEQSNFKRGILLRNIEEIVSNDELRRKLSENIYKFYFPDATEKLAREIMSLAQ